MKKLSLALALLLAAQPAMAATTTVQLNVQTPATGPTQPFDFDNDGTNNWSLTRCWDGVTKCSLNSTDGGLNVHMSNATIIQAGASVPINISSATTTQLVALSAGKAIYVTSWDVVAGGTGDITLEFGTGSNCAVGATALTGAYNLTAQFGIAKGNGLGPVLIVPPGNSLCALTSAAVQMSGSVSFVQQ